MTAVLIRPGVPGDAPVLVDMFDRAIVWLTERGRTGQWGSTRASDNPRFRGHAEEFAHSDGLHIATVDGEPAGALAVGVASEYVPVADEPELYIRLLLTDRRYAGHRIGARLLDHAADLARERGVDLLRVDCYAGDDRALVGYYERQGFTATTAFTVAREPKPWPGQVLERRLP